MPFRLPLLCLTLLLCVAGCLVPAKADELDFAHDVAPLLKKHCGQCHSQGKSKGGFSFNTRRLLLESEAVQPGDAAASRLVELIESQDVDDQMPPLDLPRLSGDQIQVLRRWIDAGAPWEPGFTFAGEGYDPPLAPREVRLPEATAGRLHPIDRILDAYANQHGLSQPSRMPDPDFLRRVSLDLVGLPPTEAELEAFLNDASPDKRTAAIDRLLNSNRDYAEHWITFWNDLLRNAYAGTGYIDGGRKQITAWLYQSLLDNKSFDRFVQELVAPDESSEGFVRGIKWRGAVNASQVRELQFSQNVSQVFLGINMKCASCHDSFVDRWTLQEAYGLAAIYSQRPLEIHRCDKPTGKIAEAAWIYPELGSVDPTADQPTRLKQAASLITHQQNGRFARTIANRLWARLMGRGLVHPVDAMHTRPWNEDLLDLLANQLVKENYDLKQVLRFIVLSEAYQSPATVMSREELQAEPFVFRGPVVKRMTAEQYLDSIRTVVGVWPAPDSQAFQLDGRGQGGQLAAVLQAHPDQQTWGERPLRAALTPRDPLQAALGRPNREQVVSERPALLTTLEAIDLANGQGMAELLAAGAQQVLAERTWSGEQLAAAMYRRALSREPTAAEQEIAGEVLGEELEPKPVEDFLWILFALPEFQLIR